MGLGMGSYIFDLMYKYFKMKSEVQISVDEQQIVGQFFGLSPKDLTLH
jgi:hypothetical protein